MPASIVDAPALQRITPAELKSSEVVGEAVIDQISGLGSAFRSASGCDLR
jgi:hypothetical protein